MRTLGFFICLGLTLLLCACAPTSAPRATLRIGIGSEVTSLDPALATSIGDNRVLSALFEGLVLPAQGSQTTPTAGVAQSWETSADGLTTTFHLNPAARWADGTPLTSADFLYSYQRLLTPALASPNAPFFDAIAGATAFRKGHCADFATVGIKAPAAHTLTITLARPSDSFLPSLAGTPFYPVQRACVEKSGSPTSRANRWARAGSLVGNGPFTLTAHRLYAQLTAVKNQHYHDASTVRLQQIDFLPIDNRASEEMAFLSHQLDLTMSLPLYKVAAYKNSPALRTDPALQVEYLLLNTRVAPLNNPAVRQALSLALNRQALCTQLLKAGQKPAYNFVPPTTGGYTGAPLLTEDPAQAKKLLSNIGFPQDSLVYRFNSSEARKAVAETLQAQIKSSTGITIALENLEWKSFLAARQAGQYSLARAGWSADINDPANFLELFLSDNPNNTTGWSSPAYDAAVHARQFATAEKVLLTELPIIPLYFTPNVYLCSPRVHGWLPNPLDLHVWKNVWVE